MSNTDHFGLKRIGPGDKFQDESYKYTDADRITVDRLLWQALNHVHTGDIGPSEQPSSAPVLTLDSTAGAIPAGTRVYYKYTHVDIYGNESAASGESYIDTPQPINSPGSPTLTKNTGTGSLLFGNYLYVLTAYEDVTTEETLGVNTSWITVATGDSITLTMPAAPTGADGFNIYRKKPGGIGYLWLDSVTVATTTYEDDGSVTEDPNRTIPSSNTTNSTNSITIGYPGGVVTSGYTWKIYRSYSSGDYSNSLLHHVVEETFQGSGVITPEYSDVGSGTYAGEPPASTFVVSMPSPIDLDDMNEVAGDLPPGGIAAYPVVIELKVTGDIEEGTKLDYWVCEYESAVIKGIRAVAIDGPNSTSLIVDVHKGTLNDFPVTSTTVFTNQGNRPAIPNGGFYSDVEVPDVTAIASGDVLYLDVDQDGGGATPTASDLRVYVRLYVTHSSTNSTTPTWT